MSKSLPIIVLFLTLFLGIGLYLKYKPVETPKDIKNFWKNVPEWETFPQNSEPKSLPNAPIIEIGQDAKSYNEALEIAKNTKKNVFLYFHSDDCGWCAKLDVSLKDSSVSDRMKSYVYYSVDTKLERELTKKYSIYGIPALKIIDENENVLKTATGFQTPEKLLEFMK